MPRDLSLSSIFLHLIKNIYCLCKMVLKISKLQDVEKAPLRPAKNFEKQNKIEVETTGPWKQRKLTQNADAWLAQLWVKIFFNQSARGILSSG